MLGVLKDLEKKQLIKLLAGLALVIIVLLVIGRQIGYNMNVAGEVISAAAELDAEYQEKLSALDKINANIQTAQSELDANNSTLEELNSYKMKKADFEKQLAGTQQKIADSDSQLKILNEQIATKQQELDRVTANVTKAAGAPITLPAGTFTVGIHIPAGRYKITGSSNLISDNINIILGGRYGVPEYVTDLVDGDVLNCSGVDTFTPLDK